MVAKVDFTIDEIKEEARHLVEKGKTDRHQPIYLHCKFIPPKDWICVECELERNDYFLRDHIVDLLTKEEWEED